jgi:hypothetical protein
MDFEEILWEVIFEVAGMYSETLKQNDISEISYADYNYKSSEYNPIGLYGDGVCFL